MASSIDVIVAALDLKEVQLLVRAMRNADAQAARSRGGLSQQPAATTLSPTEPAARFEPRPVIHPTPRYEPRPVIHPKPRIEPCELNQCCRPPAPPPIVVEKVPAELPLQPPWKTLPWENPPQPAPKVKLACYHPDIIRKGLLLDSFI